MTKSNGNRRHGFQNNLVTTSARRFARTWKQPYLSRRPRACNEILLPRGREILDEKALCPADSFHRLVPMAKQSLGRDLGALMGGKPKEGAAPVSAGVRSLMRGHQTSAPGAAPRPVLPRWYLLAGDVLLVALALLTIYKSPHPLSWPRGLFCAALVMLAAGLAVLALLTPGSNAGHRSE
jgi:hypothetical protein